MRDILKVLEGLKSIWLWAIIAGVVILLFASESDLPSGWNYLEKGVVEVTGPVQKMIARTSQTVKGLWEGYFFFVGLREENQRLRKQVEELSEANSKYREMVAAHDRLADLLRFRRELPGRVVASRVIGRDPTGWFKSIIIDKGETSGIKVNMPVTHAFGVVGRIVAVSPNHSKVLLIIDQNSSVDSLIQTTRERGMFKGFSSEVCRLDYVTKSSKAKTGDTVVTSGLGGVFPKGLPLGKIISVRKSSGSLFKDIDVQPLVDFSKLEEVLVVIGEDLSTLK
jgi:rod shape-determining protein MreC